MQSQQDMSDRLEIQDLLAAYCDAIDRRDFDVLDEIFVDGAVVDYSAVGGAKGRFPDIKNYLARGLQQFSAMQHMLGLPLIRLDGDKATARTTTFNPMVVEREGSPHVFFVGGWYIDDLIRTPKGWRIQTRREEGSYFHNVPSDFQAVDPEG